MAPLSSQLSIDYLTPRDFARRPTQWLNLISRNRGTIAYSPSFGYDLASAPRRQPGAGRSRPVELAPRRHRRRHDPARRARPLRRDVRAGGLRPQGLHPELRHGRGLPRHHLQPARHGRAHRHDRPRRPGRQPARACRPPIPQDERRARRFVLCGKVLPGPSPGSARRGRQGAGRPRGRTHLRRRSQHHAGLFRRARGHARGAVATTVGSIPATSATCWRARSSSPAAPRT